MGGEHRTDGHPLLMASGQLVERPVAELGDPEEIEDLLARHEDISQVFAVGLVDDRWGEIGCAVVVPAPGATLTEDDVLTAVLDAGAEDVSDLGDSFEVVAEPGDLVAVRTALQDAGIDYDSAEASFQPSVSVPVDVDGARKVFKLVDALEESDDVQNVYTNVDLSDEVLAALDEE